jgi:hypothetical protein
MQETNDPNDSEHLPVIPMSEVELSPIDALIQLSISKNQMEAYLRIIPPMNGGSAPTFKDFEYVLTNRNITYGVKTAKMRVLAAHPIYNTDHLIATGLMPVNGINGTYVFHFSLENDYRPKERPDGTVDYRDLGIVENVKKGQLLCTITHPTDGSEGTALNGLRLKQVKGKAFPSLSGKNTELSEDGTAIYSIIDGQVKYDGRKINVSETLFLSGDVNKSTGNIKFVGNVIIDGTVLDNFVVEAGGNIEIGGTVGSATLKADGNILLRSGIIGSEMSCKGDLTSKFIENCNVFSKGNIKADYIMNSNIKCNSLTLVGSKGKFLGGSCMAGKNITAHIIGSITGIETNLKIGIDPSIFARQQELVKQLPGLEKQLNSLKTLISLLKEYESAKRLAPDKEIILENAKSSYDERMNLYLNSKEELSEINETIKSGRHGILICTGTIFPGTKITIGSARMLVTNAYESTSLFYSEGCICQGPVRPGN